MRKIIQAIVAVMIVLLCFNGAQAVPKNLRAKSEYLLAQKRFDRKDYRGAIENLTNVKTLLNLTNSKIQYLMVKSYAALKSYSKAKAELDLYFSVTPESASSTDQYIEMVMQLSLVEDGLKAEAAAKRRALERQKEIEQARQAELAREREEERKQEELSKRRINSVGGRWELIHGPKGMYERFRKFPRGQIITIFQTGQDISFHCRYQNGCIVDDNGTATVTGTYADWRFNASFDWCGEGAYRFKGTLNDDGNEIKGYCGSGRGGSDDIDNRFKMVRVDPDEDPRHYAGSAPIIRREKSMATCFIDTVIE